MTVTELSSRRLGAGGQQGDETAAARWRPARGGIVNVWRYYGETFEFHNGRLLLRGPNGTGKSKALELLLPYLLDANLRPHRLSTFGSADRTMHWNLMGEGADGTTRVGYVWLEFARSRAGGRQWFTCGARLQASTHTTNVSADYFTTTQRIGTPDGLSLLGPDGRPLARAALAEAIGDAGRTYGSAGEYRAAVRKTLFGSLNEQRYDALITALLQLRTPKLSERLDPALLSTLLSRALPSIGQAEIAELAEGFERLDRQRDRLQELDREVDAAQTLASRQRGYAQRVLRGAAAVLISATSQLDKLTRTGRRSQRQYESTVAERAELTGRLAEIETSLDELRGRIDGLTDSESYRKGGELDRLRRQADAAANLAAQAADQARRQRAAADSDATAATGAGRVQTRQAASTAAAGDEARKAAEHADMLSTWTEVHNATKARTARGSARQLLRAAIGGRLEQIDEVRRALDRQATAVRDRQRAERELEAGRDELATATAARDAALAEHDRQLAQLADRLRDWAQRCVELTIGDPETLVGHTGSEPDVAELVGEAARAVLDQLAAERVATEAQRSAADADRAELRAEHDALLSGVGPDGVGPDGVGLTGGVELPPAAPRTRTADRDTMAGAPLWKLVAFRDGTDPAEHAAVEAALEASGLLDAWVPVSREVAVAGHDTFVEPDLAAPVAGRSLADVLEAEPDAAVPADRVRRLLAGIAYAPTVPPRQAFHATTGPPVAIGADGTWRVASLCGSWSKPEAVHIGAAARERARQRRIFELAERIAELDEVIDDLDAALDRLAQRRDAVDAELAARPGHDGVRVAREALDRAESAVAARDDAVRRAMSAVEAAEREVGTWLRALTALAAEHRLPADPDALDRVRTATDSVRGLGELWLDRHHDLQAAIRTAESARATAQRSAELAAELEAAAGEREAEARRLQAAAEAAQHSVGAGYRKIVDEIAELRAAARDREAEAKELNAKLMDLATSIGKLDTRRSVESELRDAAIVARDEAAARLRHLAGTSLPVDAGLTLDLPAEDGTKATLDAARHVAAQLSSVPYEPRNIRDAEARLAEGVHTCGQLLANRAELSIEPDGETQLLSAAVDGVRVGAAELLDSVRAERDSAQSDITSAERELFDKTLTGDTRRHLAARIRQASELVAAMNARLERVRTASKVSVHLVWQVDPQLPAGTKKARELLLKDPAKLSDADRESLHKFFRDRVDEARAADTAESWEQQLLQVFDYTRWHRFDVKVDRANGAGWQLLTKRLHGALSGGEKAIALHLPLFAAVAAHYQSAPGCPRLILLDEVFVGVDATNRGQVFELLASLDLDLMLTSDHEWCTYRELDGIAIHQLITGGSDDQDDAVTTARFVWDGRQLTTDESSQPA